MITRWRHGLRVLQRVLTRPNSESFSVREQNPDSSWIFRFSVWALAVCSARIHSRAGWFLLASRVESLTLSLLPEHSPALVSLCGLCFGLLFSENLYCACRCSSGFLGSKSFNPSVPPFLWVGWLKREGKLRKRNGKV